MLTKMFEIRDSATFIPVIAIKLRPDNESERYLLGRTGYGIHPEDQAQYVIVLRADCQRCSYDPHSWGAARTMPVAHQYIIEHFDELESGAVIDVEYLEDETTTPKVSERVDDANS